jgi:hypothetical protein
MRRLTFVNEGRFIRGDGQDGGEENMVAFGGDLVEDVSESELGVFGFLREEVGKGGGERGDERGWVEQGEDEVQGRKEGTRSGAAVQ